MINKLKITTTVSTFNKVAVYDAKGYTLWKKTLFGWKKICESSSSDEIRKIKNHLFLPDKIYTRETNKESE